MSDDAPEDGDEPEGGGGRGGTGRVPWIIAETRVMIAELGGQMGVDFERFSKEAAERENRLVNRMMIIVLSAVGIATAFISMLIALVGVGAPSP